MNTKNISTELRAREAKKVTSVGFGINALLTAFKIFAGISGKSGAMIADGVHSLSDFFTDIVVLIGFKITEKPEDENHNYGHGKFETLATMVISIALFLVGLKIFSSGIENVYQVLAKGKILEKPGLIALIAAAFSILSKEALYHYTKKVGLKIQSSAVVANAWHHRSDAFSSIGTLFGIGFAILLGDQWTILDPIASIIVSIFVFKVSFEIFLPAVNELMEVSLADNEVAMIKDRLESHPEIINYHHLRTRKIGYKSAIEVHLVFNKMLSIQDVHQYATDVENQIKNDLGVESIITTHLEPSK